MRGTHAAFHMYLELGILQFQDGTRKQIAQPLIAKVGSVLHFRFLFFPPRWKAPGLHVDQEAVGQGKHNNQFCGTRHLVS